MSELTLPGVSNGCTGKCCVIFTLPWKLTELAEHASRVEDGAQIVSMVQQLTLDEARERCERFGLDEPDSTIEHFACRNWNEETGLCEIYEERPRMCRCYPDGECTHDPLCTCTGESRAEAGSVELQVEVL